MGPIIVIGSLRARCAYDKMEAEGEAAHIEFFRISYKMKDSFNLVSLTCFSLIETSARRR